MVPRVQWWFLQIFSFTECFHSLEVCPYTNWLFNSYDNTLLMVMIYIRQGKSLWVKSESCIKLGIINYRYFAKNSLSRLRARWAFAFSLRRRSSNDVSVFEYRLLRNTSHCSIKLIKKCAQAKLNLRTTHFSGIVFGSVLKLLVKVCK